MLGRRVKISKCVAEILKCVVKISKCVVNISEFVVNLTCVSKNLEYVSRDLECVVHNLKCVLNKILVDVQTTSSSNLDSNQSTTSPTESTQDSLCRQNTFKSI